MASCPACGKHPLKKDPRTKLFRCPHDGVVKKGLDRAGHKVPT